MSNLAIARRGMELMLREALLTANGVAEADADDAQFAAAENAAARLFDAMAAAAPSWAAFNQLMGRVQRALAVQIGDFAGETLSASLLAGGCAAAAIERAQAPPTPLGPRDIMRRQFATSLETAAAAVAAAVDRECLREIAAALEKGCYNRAIVSCRDSENPPHRSWETPAFVDVYSGRCGTLLRLLDPDSQPCREFGAVLIARLLAAPGAPERLTPDEAAVASEAEICPQATEKERAEIASRQASRLAVKSSALFRCPRCGDRNCTYVQEQGRSSDEMADHLCVCQSCKQKWRERS